MTTIIEGKQSNLEIFADSSILITTKTYTNLRRSLVCTPIADLESFVAAYKEWQSKQI